MSGKAWAFIRSTNACCAGHGVGRAVGGGDEAIADITAGASR